MKGAIFCLCAALALLGCGRAVMLPKSTAMPVKAVDEGTDEWLHDHCDVKQVVSLDPESIERKALSAGSNFVEVVYTDGDGVGVVMFACKQMPPGA